MSDIFYCLHFCLSVAVKHDLWFSINIHHGGYFANLSWKGYVGGIEDYFDLCHMDKISMVDIDEMVKELGYSGWMNYYWTLPYHSLPLEEILRD